MGRPRVSHRRSSSTRRHLAASNATHPRRGRLAFLGLGASRILGQPRSPPRALSTVPFVASVSSAGTHSAPRPLPSPYHHQPSVSRVHSSHAPTSPFAASSVPRRPHPPCTARGQAWRRVDFVDGPGGGGAFDGTHVDSHTPSLRGVGRHHAPVPDHGAGADVGGGTGIGGAGARAALSRTTPQVLLEMRNGYGGGGGPTGGGGGLLPNGGGRDARVRS